MGITSEAVREAAEGLGFLNIGVAPAVPPPHFDAYRTWVEAGRHGDMAYLASHLPLKAHPEALLAGCRSVIAVALNYNQPNPVVKGEPRIAKYALGRDYHKVLRGKLRQLESRLAALYPESSWRACVDSAPILERDYAQLAGLGWFGKNTCLIDSKFGSFFFIGLLLTDLEISPDEPSLGGCGTCQKCIEACPTGAIQFLEGRWQVVGSQCISYLTIEYAGEIPAELAAKIGDWTFGCDVCQDVCPFNEQRETQPERGSVTEEGDFLAKRRWPSLRELTVLQESEWDALTQGSPLRRTGREGLIRNAKVNLRNSG